jgi:hypothetical protein
MILVWSFFPLVRPRTGVVMSMQPRPWSDVPEQTAWMARASFREGNRALLECLVGPGLVRARGRQRTDSTHVLGAIRDMNRLELAGETLRAALEALAVAAPAWLAQVIGPSWRDVYGARIDNLHLPDSATKRAELMVGFGRDGYHLLDAVHGPDAPGWLRELLAVAALRLIRIQQFYRDVDNATGRQEVRRREKAPDGDGLPPGRDAIISPYDLASIRGRGSVRSRRWGRRGRGRRLGRGSLRRR